MLVVSGLPLDLRSGVTVKIVSTTLAGTSQVKDVGLSYALASVAPFVDECIVIVTRGPASERIMAECFAGAQGKARIVEWPWQGDFAKARNVALGMARQSGADWAFTIDDDERIETHGEDVRAFLDATDKESVLSFDEEETYLKHRAIRCASSALWVGVTHEGVHNLTSTDRFPRLKFSELEKSPAELLEKFARDERMLSVEVKRDPLCTRSWYYLGISFQGVGDLESAIDAFRKCARLRGHNEEGAWACYKAASLLVHLKRYEEAIEVAGAGLVRDPGIGELCTIAALAALKNGDAESSQCWSDLARVHSSKGGRALTRRTGFRDPTMLARGEVGAFEAWTTPPVVTETGKT
jgi:hypothetical protein